MRALVPRAVGWAVAAGLAITASLAVRTAAAASGSTRSAACPPAGWCWEYPELTRSSFEAVGGTSANDVWVVGSGAGGTILHWDGVAWSREGSPDEPRSIHVRARDDIWIGGDSTVLHGNGRAWSPIPGPPVSITCAMRAGSIDAGPHDELWLSGCGVHRLLDGAWRSVAPFWGNVLVTGSDDAWFWSEHHLFHWNGIGFAKVVDGPPTIAFLGGERKDDVWAVTVGGSLWRWNGARWTREREAPEPPPPQPGVSIPYERRPASGIAPDQVWRVGPQGRIDLFDERRGWTRVASPDESDLLGVWARTRDDAWAVGEAGTILRWGGRTWARIRNGEPKALKAIAAVAGQIWAVGTEGFVLRGAGGAWTVLPPPSAETLEAVWGAAPDDVWAAGEWIWHWDGARWSRGPDEAKWVKALWGAGPDEIWAVGEKVLRWDGKRWAVVAVPHGTLEGVSATGPDDVWAVGYSASPKPTERGLVWHWDGKRAAETQMVVPLRAVWASAPDDVYAGSFEGDGLHWDGRTWTWSREPVSPVAALWGNGRKDIWIADPSGQVRRWAREEIDPRGGVGKAVAMTGAAGRLWLVGNVDGRGYVASWPLPAAGR